jgi:NADPH2:quinone reductase
VPKAIRIYENGGPEVLRWEDVDVPQPGPGEILLRHTAIGLNYADVNLRNGTFYIHTKLPLPAILGNEGAGVVEGLGSNVDNFKVGGRVVYVSPSGMAPPGSYSELRVVAADQLVNIPENISDQQAAASFLKGLTAWCIVRRIFPVRPGHIILVHAAAGGAASFLSQWSKHLGATVIGTVGSTEKAEAARAAGCDHTILYREVDFVQEVNQLFPDGVSAVFDGVGKDTFLPSLECLDPFGTLVNFGNASGAPPPLDIRLLGARGSEMVTRMGMGFFFKDREIQAKAAAEIFDLMTRGILTARIERTYPLCDAAQAHRDLEGRRTIGSVVLIP